jgi:hypothetical protein
MDQGEAGEATSTEGSVATGVNPGHRSVKRDVVICSKIFNPIKVTTCTLYSYIFKANDEINKKDLWPSPQG